MQGAKNSALPLMAAILCSGETVLENVPQITDVTAARRILSAIGCRSTCSGDVLTIDGANPDHFEIPDDDMRKMRSSIMFLAPILARLGSCVITVPGG